MGRCLSADAVALRQRRRAIAVVLFASAGALLLVAFLTPIAYEAIQNLTFPPGSTFRASSDFYAGTQFLESCTGSGCNAGTTATHSYGQAMADLYTAVWWVLAAGLLIAVLSAAFAALGARGRPTLLLTWTLAAVGVGAALLAPITVLAFQPHAYSMDVMVPSYRGIYFPCNQPGPSVCTSFFGSASPYAGGTLVWGPGVGWYAALAAGALFLAGAFLSRPPRDDPRRWEARFAVLTVLLGLGIFAAVYSVLWRTLLPGLESPIFLLGLLIVAGGVCSYLVVRARRKLARARESGWSPS
jgi:hypothetical protein